MPLSEEACWAEEGARAARRGLRWDANPFLRRENMPAATGDSPPQWARKHDAWQRGFDGEGPSLPTMAWAPVSPTRSAELRAAFDLS